MLARFANSIEPKIDGIDTRLQACVTAIGAVATPRQFEAVNRSLRDVVEKTDAMAKKVEKLELAINNIDVRSLNERPMSKEELEKRADIAVRTLLPKHSQKSLIQFFAEDSFRQDAMVRYLKSVLPHSDPSTFMLQAFKKIVHDDGLKYMEWPHVL